MVNFLENMNLTISPKAFAETISILQKKSLYSSKFSKLHYIIKPFDLGNMTITSQNFLACDTGDVNMSSWVNMAAVWVT